MSESSDREPTRIDFESLGRDPLQGAKRFAKRFLQQLRAADEQVLRLAERHHPRPERVRAEAKLADAQLIVARMLEYKSWPQLAHHLQRLSTARRELDEGAPPPDGDASTVHVRCGSDIQRGLAEAGYNGAFVEFSDPYCQGPVVAADQQERIETRASFMAHAYEAPLDEVRDKLQAQYRAVETLDHYERVVLWFEHDSYDQLILAALLSHLHRRPHRCVELVCVDAYPGRPKFRGLGELSTLSLRSLWAQRRVVTQPDLELGNAVWTALQRPDPRDLATIATATPGIPAMANAIRRHLMELPWRDDGLSLMQRLLLEAVATGCDRAGATFRTYSMSLEPLPFAGDAMVWWEIRELTAGGALALAAEDGGWPRWGVALTDLGRALLAGRADWVSKGRRTRWVGGIECGPQRPPWRWDPDRNEPVLADRRR